MPPVAAKPVGARPSRGCQLSDLFALLGESYVLDILNLLIAEPRPRRFIEIQRALQLSPNTLTFRLGRLVEAGLLKRTAYHEIPPRVDYELTKKATALEDAFASLKGWARNYNLAPEQAAP